MRRIALFVAIILFLSACSTNSDEGLSRSTPMASSFGVEVDIIHPLQGTVIYAETIVVTGTLFGAEQESFALQFVNPNGDIISEVTQTVRSGEWEVEVPHGYSGDPTPITLRAVPSNSESGAYDSVAIFMADISYRPEGTFASVRSPEPDASVGGDFILVEGTVSGLSGNTIQIALVDEDGNVLSEEQSQIFNPFVVDEVPLQVELTPSNYVGDAEIQIIDSNNASGGLLISVPVIIGDSAG